MRIAYMLTSLGIGGAERQVIALAERMRARGHEVVLVVLRQRQVHEWQTEIKVMRLEMTKSPLAICSGLFHGRGFLRDFKPDLVHSHTFPANIAARMLHAGAAPKVLSTIHNIYEGGRVRTLAYRLTDSLSIHTTAVSQAVAERYVQTGAVPRDKCSVLTNGIDTNRFSPSDTTAALAREFMFVDDEFIWMAAGRIIPAKDFDNLLVAFRLVRAEEKRTQLWIAGHLDAARPVRIAGQIVGRERYESDGVRWLGFRDDMESILAPANAFVLSSAWEGMPLVVGEAMAMEKPVVATDVGGVRELVGDVGLIVPSKNPQALAEAMLRMMRMPSSRRIAMGKAARARIIQHFDMNAKADEWESLYTRLLSDRR